MSAHKTSHRKNKLFRLIPNTKSIDVLEISSKTTDFITKITKRSL